MHGDCRVGHADTGKELLRKLYWAISSTCSLTKEQKVSTLRWCARISHSIALRYHESPPSRLQGVDKTTNSQYAALAGGGAAGGGTNSLISVVQQPPPDSFSDANIENMLSNCPWEDYYASTRSPSGIRSTPPCRPTRKSGCRYFGAEGCRNSPSSCRWRSTGRLWRSTIIRQRRGKEKAPAS